MSNFSEISDPREEEPELDDEQVTGKRKRADGGASLPDWYVHSKHHALAPKLIEAGGFPVSSDRFPGLGNNVVLYDGIRDMIDAPVDIRAANGKSAATAELLGKNFYYVPFVNNKRPQVAVYGTVYDAFTVIPNAQTSTDLYVAKVKTDNVKCEDLERFQGKPEYRKTPAGDFELVPPGERDVEKSYVFRASVEAWRYPHVTKVSEKYLSNTDFFDDVPNEEALGDKTTNKWVNLFVRDAYGDVGKSKWNANATEYRNMQYKTGFFYPCDALKDAEGNVQQFRTYTAPDGVVSFRVEIPVQKDGNGYVFKHSATKDQKLEAEKGKSKPMEFKKVTEAGFKHPDADELMADFAPGSGPKTVLVVNNYQAVQSDKKASPIIKSKPIKFVYEVVGSTAEGEDFV